MYNGSSTGLSASPNWIGESNQLYAELGHGVSTAGDVNGDGYGDIVAGALFTITDRMTKGGLWLVRFFYRTRRKRIGGKC